MHDFVARVHRQEERSQGATERQGSPGWGVQATSRSWGPAGMQHNQARRRLSFVWSRGQFISSVYSSSILCFRGSRVLPGAISSPCMVHVPIRYNKRGDKCDVVCDAKRRRFLPETSTGRGIGVSKGNMIGLNGAGKGFPPSQSQRRPMWHFSAKNELAHGNTLPTPSCSLPYLSKTSACERPLAPSILFSQALEH